jgi:ERCC4-type nuclease
MHLIIDNREQGFIEILQTLQPSQYPHFTVEIKPLDIGDMEVYHEDTLLFVWERKTFSDLLSSIQDGRYKEQSHRLLHVHGASKVIYLIEGILSQLKPPDKRRVQSAITSLTLCKKFHCWRSVHLKDSVESFLVVCDKLYRDLRDKKITLESLLSRPDPSATDNSKSLEMPKSYTEVVKKVKKENVTPENIGEILLCQIPSISSTCAKALMDVTHGDFPKFVHIVQTQPELLDSVRVGSPKPRKISKAILENVKKYLGKREPNISEECADEEPAAIHDITN